jgi:hypothetical protein
MSNELAKFTIKTELLINTEKYTRAEEKEDYEQMELLVKANKAHEWIEAVIPIDLNEVESIGRLRYKGYNLISIKYFDCEKLIKDDKYTWDIICSSACLICNE